MTRGIIHTCIIVLLLSADSLTLAQPGNIIINEELAANSEMLQVKTGNQWAGKVFKFKFGDYAVVDSKRGWTVKTSRTNFWNTRTESKTEGKFSFVLAERKSDSVIVNALSDISVKEMHAFIFSAGSGYEFSFGSDELLERSLLFSAFVSTSSNLDDIWILQIEQTEGSQTSPGHGGVFGNEERLMSIIPASSNKYGEDTRVLPAMGYEFVENDKALCAMQYYGGGAFGMNKIFIWLSSDLEPEMKLILAGAMTALMQFKITQFG